MLKKKRGGSKTKDGGNQQQGKTWKRSGRNAEKKDVRWCPRRGSRERKVFWWRYRYTVEKAKNGVYGRCVRLCISLWRPMPGSKLNLDGDRPFSCHVGLQLDHGGRRIRHLAVAFGDPRQAPHPMGRGRLGQLALVDAQLLRQPHNG